MESTIRIYDGERLIEHCVPFDAACTIGKGINSTIRYEANWLGKKTLQIRTRADSWDVFGAGIKHTNIPYEKTVVLCAEERVAIAAFLRRAEKNVLISLLDADRVTVGRNSDCDIQISDPRISSQHLVLFYSNGRWNFQDSGSRNGTYHNGHLSRQAELGERDVLSIGFCKMSLSNDRLTVWSSYIVRSNLNVRRKNRTAQTPDEEYPYCVKPSPRLIEEVPEETVELQAPPSIGGKPNVSWLNVLLAPALSVTVMLVVCLLITNVMTMLYFSVPTTCIGALMSFLRYQSEKKKYRQKEQLRLKKYGHYLRESVSKLERLQVAQRNALTHMSPATSDCIRMAERTDSKLWGRLLRDEDFLSLRVGSGSLPASFSLQAPRQLLQLESDLLAEQPAQLVERFAEVNNCPICLPLGEHLSCGVVGKRAKCVTLGKNLIVQAAAHHSYDNLRIVVLCDEAETEQWNFCRWLPHCWDEENSIRLIANTLETSQKLLNRLETVLAARAAADNRNPLGVVTQVKPWYLFLCATPGFLVRHSIMKYIAANRPELGVCAIYLFDRIDALPEQCHDILDCRGKRNHLFERKHASQKQEFELDTVGQEAYMQFARSLAPLRVEEKGAAALPRSVTFLQGYHISLPSELPLQRNWSDGQPEKSMAVPIGVRAGGVPFLFDIHEKKHGPHGLVAGMTGSGKSEMVQSWILSMAIRFAPDTVSFVLIDFKGTGLLLPFQNLPHLAGSISDLDTGIGRNLIALEYELTRRKELLDRWSVSNISDYRRLLHEGKADEPLSYLFIVIDEFAEFKNRFPDFMQAVNRVFAIGRTLGVHMILLTQKPTSIVDDKMSANTRFRWCLKVASSADSREMLHHSDAAQITTPGRAFVQVGEDEVYEQIQSYWSGAPYLPMRDTAAQPVDQIAVVDLYGNRHTYEPEKTTGYRSEKKEIDVIVDYLCAYCKEHGISKARQLWTSRLPERLYLRAVIDAAFDGTRWKGSKKTLEAAIGLLDDPAAQAQYPLCLQLSASGSHTIYGAPSTGKTTLLHTAIMSLALSYCPDQLHLYLMDFGGGSLNLFRNLPHVGGVVESSDEERMEKLMTMLLNTLNERKKLINEQGLVSIAAYREATGVQMPWIVLVLDNFAPVMELYPAAEPFFQTIVREGASCGIYLLASVGASNALPYRIAQHVKMALCLRMTDRGDYAQIVGRTNGLEPEDHAGRGLLQGVPPLEFQTALPASAVKEIERVEQIRQLADMMRRAWTGACPLPIPVLPERVCWREYPSDQLLCGLTEKTVQPCYVPLTQTQFLLLSYTPGTEASVRAIIAQAEKKLSPAEQICFDDDDPQSAVEFDRQIAALMPMLQQRKDADSDHPQWPWILICVNNLRRCIDSIDDQTLRRLVSVICLGKRLGVALIAAGGAADITKLSSAGERLTMELIKQPTLLLGASAQTHMFIRTDLPYSVASQDNGPEMGYLIQDGHAIKLKVVQE